MSTQRQLVEQTLRKRYARESRFQWYGRIAILVGVLFLAFLLVTTFGNAYKAVFQTYVHLDIDLSAEQFGGEINAGSIEAANFDGIIKQSLRDKFPEVTNRRERRVLYGLISNGAQYDLRQEVLENPDLAGGVRSFWLLADDEVDMFMKGRIDASLPESDRRLKDNAIGWIEALIAEDQGGKALQRAVFHQR